MAYSEDDIERAAQLASALDSPLRLHILVLLASGEHVVHELVAKLGKSQPLISQHLRVLKRAGLVDSARRGREVEYTLASPKVEQAIECLVALSDPGTVVDIASRRSPAAPSTPDPDTANGGAAAIINPPGRMRPDLDPGLHPTTPKPQRD